jgi:hypothetical protein
VIWRQSVHHVRLVKLDLEEERRDGGVRRPGVASIRGPDGDDEVEWTDGRAHDEALERLAVPRAAAADLVRERLDPLHGRELERWGGDEAPLARKRLEDGSWPRLEVLRAFVDAVQAQAALFSGVREDVLLEIVVAELRENDDEVRTPVWMWDDAPHLSNSLPVESPRAAPSSFLHALDDDAALAGLSVILRDTLHGPSELRQVGESDRGAA